MIFLMGVKNMGGVQKYQSKSFCLPEALIRNPATVRSEQQWRDSKGEKTFFRDFITILASKIGIFVNFCFFEFLTSRLN